MLPPWWLYRRQTFPLSRDLKVANKSICYWGRSPSYFGYCVLFLTYQITKESTRYSYHTKQESCFARWQVKQCLHDFWHERCCSCESKILQADAQCDEYERNAWKQKFCCFGKIFQLGVASFFSSIFCYFVFFGLGENLRNFTFEPLISSKEI